MDGHERNSLKLRKLTIAHGVPTTAVYFVLCAPQDLRGVSAAQVSGFYASWRAVERTALFGILSGPVGVLEKPVLVLIDHPDATEETRESCKVAIQAMDDAISS